MKAGQCEYGGNGRFGTGEPQCKRTDVRGYNAGCYGGALLCSEHAHIATGLCEEARGAEAEAGTALAQILRDERAMMGRRV